MSNLFQFENLVTLLDRNMDFAKNYFNDHKNLKPMIIGYDSLNNPYVIPLTFQNDDEKYRLLEVIKIFFTLKEIKQYVAIFEAYIATLKPQDKEFKGAVRDHPDKQDGLCAIAVNKIGTRGRLYTVSKDMELIPAGEDVSEIKGIFTELLPKNKFNEYEKKKLEELLTKLGMVLISPEFIQ